jgi:hypothetical protein
MANETEWGFPKGRVAKTLRTLLYKDLTDHDIEAIVVCLMSHLLVEDHINTLLYNWFDLPALTLKTPIDLENRPTKNSRNRFPSYNSDGTHLRDEQAPLGRRTHGEMDRFLQEVTDEAHLGAHTARGLSPP